MPLFSSTTSNFSYHKFIWLYINSKFSLRGKYEKIDNYFGFVVQNYSRRTTFGVFRSQFLNGTFSFINFNWLLKRVTVDFRVLEVLHKSLIFQHFSRRYIAFKWLWNWCKRPVLLCFLILSSCFTERDTIEIWMKVPSEVVMFIYYEVKREVVLRVACLKSRSIKSSWRVHTGVSNNACIKTDHVFKMG